MHFTKILTNRSFWLWTIFCTSVLFLGSFLFWTVIISLNNGTHMDTFGANGTFQLYNPLRRLTIGQIIGYDFPFFHGIGIPFLHLPIFSLLGGGVFAAETAKWLISPLLFLSSSFIFFYAYFRKFKESVIALALLTAAGLSWVDIIWPGNSLLGTRGIFPVLIAAALLWHTNRLVRIKNYTIPTNEVIALVLLGLSPLFGTEQGIAAILSYALIGFVVIIRNRSINFVKNIAILALKCLFILIIALIAYSIFTAGHPFSAIKYAFIDIPTDQGWYFGTDPQNFMTWGNLIPELLDFRMCFIWATIILGTTSIYIFFKKLKQEQLKKPIWYMVNYGILAFIISITGYYAPSSQLLPLQRMMALIFIVLAVSLASNKKTWQQLKIHHSKHTNNIKIIVLYLAIAIALGSTLTVAYIKITDLGTKYDIIATLKLAKKARHADDYFAASINWKDSLDEFRPYIDPTKTIWSLYTSVYDTVFGKQLNPSSGGEDYIIHALGDERRAAYESEFIKSNPHYVITLKPNYFTFEEWLWINHWNIYKQIFTQYSLVAENATHYLWEIKTIPQEKSNPSYSAAITNNSISLPGNNTKDIIVYSVDVKYKTLSTIPFTNRLPRYTITVNNKYQSQNYRISLPSQKNTWTFPVISMPGDETIKLNSTAEGMIPFADLTIQSASYTVVKIDQKNMTPIENNTCFMYHKKGVPTDYPWTCNPVTQILKLK